MNRWQAFYRSNHPIVWTLLLGTVLANVASSMALPFLAVYLSRTTEMSSLLIGIPIDIKRGYHYSLFAVNYAAQIAA